MIYILEAPDNCGKTTLANHIKKFLEQVKKEPVIVQHCTGINIYDNDDLLDREATLSLSKNSYNIMMDIAAQGYWRKYNIYHTICDRSHIGESVYAPKYRHYDGDYVFNLEKDWINQYPDLQQHIRVLFLKDTAENLIARDDGQSFSDKVADRQIELDAFDAAFNKTNFIKKNQIILTDRTKEDEFNEVDQLILEDLKDESKLCY